MGLLASSALSLARAETNAARCVSPPVGVKRALSCVIAVGIDLTHGESWPLSTPQTRGSQPASPRTRRWNRRVAMRGLFRGGKSAPPRESHSARSRRFQWFIWLARCPESSRASASFRPRAFPGNVVALRPGSLEKRPVTHLARSRDETRRIRTMWRESSEDDTSER